MGAALETKVELLGELGQYPAAAVQDVVGRLGEAVGDGHAVNIDVDQQVLTVARDALRGRRRQELGREYAPKLEASDELLWLIDTGEPPHVLACNAQAAASLGYKPEEVVGKATAMFRAEGQDWEPLRQELEARGRREGVTLVRTREEWVVPVRYDARVVELGGRRLHLVRTRVELEEWQTRERFERLMQETAERMERVLAEDGETLPAWMRERLRRGIAAARQGGTT